MAGAQRRGHEGSGRCRPGRWCKGTKSNLGGGEKEREREEEEVRGREREYADTSSGGLNIVGMYMDVFHDDCGLGLFFRKGRSLEIVH